RESTTGTLIQEVIDNKLDLVLLALPWELGPVETRTIYREGFHLAFHKDTNIIPPDTVDFDTLPDESLLLLDDVHCLREHALAGCRLKNQKAIHTFGANSLQMLVQMVDNDLGVTLIPDMAVNAGILKGTDIKTRKLPEDLFYRDIGFAWRKGNSREPFLNELMEALEAR
ncbi:MAG: hydrogen peroxide-inducible genes activator, partial [Pseudomonadales bacterium]|nr:hydrogen peroxide-inducible genes activator [Pseudomonadales bacterium]